MLKNFQIFTVIQIFIQLMLNFHILNAKSNYDGGNDDFFILKNINCLNELPISKLLKIKRNVDELMMMKTSCSNCLMPEVKLNNNETFSSIVLQNNHKKDILVNVRSDVLKINKNSNEHDLNVISDQIVKALPLISENNEIESRSFHPDVMDEKPTKLQTIFQVSVTALTFLAFGGYLLCLIVQAIKSKGTTYFHPVTSTPPIIPRLKKIKVYRRSRRAIKKKIDKRKGKSRKYRNVLAPVRTTLSSSLSPSSIDILTQSTLTAATDADATAASPSPDDLYKVLESIAEGYVKIVQFQ